MSDCLYLFCFARSTLLPALKGTGVDGRSPLFIENFRDISAVLSAACLEDYSGLSAESRMQDLAWIGPRACRHQEVVELAMSYSPVLPVRFGAIFSSLKRLEEAASRHYENISRFLLHVDDAEEWAVKGSLDRAKAEKALLSSHLALEAENLASLGPGTRYFQEQRIRAHVGGKLNTWLEEATKTIADELRRYARDFHSYKLNPRVMTEGENEMVLNWAFLVPRGNAAHFCAEIDVINARCVHGGLTFKYSGPWPPYSFCPLL